MFEDASDLDVILVPVGGGSGAAGTCLVASTIAPHCRVIGVQAAAAPAAYESWRQRQLVERPNHTFADGLATASAFALPQAMLWALLDDFVLVSDAEIQQAMVWMIEHAHTLAEPAGAAPLAAAYRLRDALAGASAPRLQRRQRCPQPSPPGAGQRGIASPRGAGPRGVVCSR